MKKVGSAFISRTHLIQEEKSHLPFVTRRSLVEISLLWGRERGLRREKLREHLWGPSIRLALLFINFNESVSGGLDFPEPRKRDSCPENSTTSGAAQVGTSFLIFTICLYLAIGKHVWQHFARIHRRLAGVAERVELSFLPTLRSSSRACILVFSSRPLLAFCSANNRNQRSNRFGSMV